MDGVPLFHGLQQPPSPLVEGEALLCSTHFFDVHFSTSSPRGRELSGVVT